VPGGAFARVDLKNGHEGDPGDSYDIVSGGGGGGNYGDPEKLGPPSDEVEDVNPIWVHYSMTSGFGRLFLIPIFHEDQLFFEINCFPNGRVK